MSATNLVACENCDLLHRLGVIAEGEAASCQRCGSLLRRRPRNATERALGLAAAAMYPAEPRFTADYRVLLDVRDFAGTLGGTVVLRVRWTLASINDGAAVAAASAALGQVTRQIAERLAALPER